METEKMKALAGKLYDANRDAELLAERAACADITHRLNSLSPSRSEERAGILRGLLGKAGKCFTIISPFFCDYGYNIEIGENFFMNFNCVILDAAKVRFGDNVFVAPNCGFYTAGHPLDVRRRNMGLEYARPISVGESGNRKTETVDLWRSEPLPERIVRSLVKGDDSYVAEDMAECGKGGL